MIINFLEQNYRGKTKLFLFSASVYFGFFALLFGFFTNAYALNLDKLKVYFLEGDYKSAISEGEKILAGAGASQGRDPDELYYILGLSYLKDENYLRASDIFEIILKEFKGSKFKEEAKLGLGDTYLLRGNYNKAAEYYKELLHSNPQTKFKAPIYYRLSEAGFKRGDTQEAKEYLDKLKEDFPANLEMRLNKDMYSFGSLADIYYAVQVGSFASYNNAKNLTNKLIAAGYDAYIQEINVGSAKVYRVRVGRLKSRSEAAQLENQLSGQGYPTKIIP